jgi:multicomponent K+:H+ antiporter subunit G
VLASIVCFSALHLRLIVHELPIGVFITATTPVTLMLLARTALYRDRTKGDANVPPRSLLRSPGGSLRATASSDTSSRDP